MQDEMANKFTRTDDLKEEFDREKIRLAAIKKFLQQYKSNLQK